LTNKTAILFFSRTSHEEIKFKDFGFGAANKCISQLFIQKTLHTLDQTDLPVVKVFSQNQRGIDFGDRLSNAIEFTFDKGFESVIVVGNDCIGLSKAKIKNAQKALLSNDYVVGPDTVGGLYLLGVNKESYQRSLLEKLAWKTTSLLKSFQKSTQHFAIHTLEALADINDAQSFKDVVRRFKFIDRFVLLLKSFIQQKEIIVLKTIENLPKGFYILFQYRGPPCLA